LSLIRTVIILLPEGESLTFLYGLRSACGKTEEEVFQKASEHAKTAHNMNEIPKDLYEKARAAIRDVKKC